VSKRILRVGIGLVVAVHVAIGLYGVNAPIQWGHQGYHVAEHGLGARNLRRFDEWQHTTHTGPRPPTSRELNFHHVSMLHPYLAVTQGLFGEAPWTARVVPLAFSLLALLGLWTFTRRVRDDTTALLAAALFALEPFTAVFVNLPNTDVVSIAAMLWMAVALHALLERGASRGRVALLLAATFVGAFHDWPFYPAAYFLLLFAAGRLAPRGRFARERTPGELRQARLALAGAALVVLAVFAQHFLRAWAAGRLGDLLGAAGARQGGAVAGGLTGVLAHRLPLLHTLPLLGAGLAWIGLVAARRRLDLGVALVASLLAAQTLWLLVFKNEFVVHEYRSSWYVPALALAGAEVAVTVGRALGRRALAPLPALLLLGAVGWRTAWLAPQARRTAGCVDTRGYDARVDQMLAARLAGALAGCDTPVFVDHALGPRLEVTWLIDADSKLAADPALALVQIGRGRETIVLLARATAEDPRWRPLLRRARIVLLDRVVLLDLVPDAAPSVETARVAERDGSWLSAWLHAPFRAPPGLAAGDAAEAAALAATFGLGDDVARAAAAGHRPVLDDPRVRGLLAP
jgi:hypothetical protein